MTTRTARITGGERINTVTHPDYPSSCLDCEGAAGALKVYLCPLHAAAPALLEAAQTFIALLDAGADLEMAETQARAAVAWAIQETHRD